MHGSQISKFAKRILVNIASTQLPMSDAINPSPRTWMLLCIMLGRQQLHHHPRQLCDQLMSEVWYTAFIKSLVGFQVKTRKQLGLL